MIRFVHTADIHFGMENYGKIDAKTGMHTRLLDFKRALDVCIDYAVEHDVDFFLFAGDAYKTHHPSQTQQKLLMQCFLRLYKANIPIVIVVGNHDHPMSFGKAHALDIFGDLPLDNFYVIAKPTTLYLETKNGPINIVGIPWPSRTTISINNAHMTSSTSDITQYISKAVAHIIADMAAKLDHTIPAVLASHVTVSSGIFSGSEKRAIYGTDPILLPSQLAIKPFDYVALGHLHRYQNLNPQGYPAIVYSGSIERIDFGERKEEKGFCVVTIYKKDDTTHTFIPVPTRPFIQIEVEITQEDAQTAQLIAEIKKYHLQNSVVKIIYHLPADIPDRVNVKAIQVACSEALYIVGIIPIHHHTMRARRFTAAYQSMDVPTMLQTFFASKPETQLRADTLTQMALELLEQKDQEHEE
ncbi:MAG TPA: exonuclease SbcCD subunit D [Candidatus Babeliales bacterium]|jgi:exonuclease SbcD|nr:exonuclease SbcCD subunit D [Candidatus Babeliales bacterium]